jgi:hypothetical protein
VANTFNYNVIVDFNLLIFLVCSWEKYFPIAKNTLQLFLSLSTMLYSQNVVENIVAKGEGGGSTTIN